MHYDIDISWDSSAGVWCAVCDEIPIALENASFDKLISRVKVATPEILSLNGKNTKNVNLYFKTYHMEKIA